MKNLLHAGVLACALTMSVAACSKHEQAADASMAESAPASAMEAAPAVGAGAPEPAQLASSPPNAQTQLQSAAVTQEQGERRFIRTATVAFRVRDVYRAALAIEDLVAQQGGFVARNDIQTQIDDLQTRPSGDGKLIELATYTVSGHLRVRVPSERTQPFLRALASQVEFLDNRTFEAVDAQFELLRQRLAYARHQDAQRALGDAAAAPGKPGEKVDAIDARANAQAHRDEAAIARATLEDRIFFATIDLSLRQSPQVRRTERLDVDAVVRRDGPGFLPRAGHALREGWYGALDVVVALVHLWPLWLAALLAVFAVRFKRRSRS